MRRAAAINKRMRLDCTLEVGPLERHADSAIHNLLGVYRTSPGFFSCAP
jgi:hypothetical protein